MDYNPGKELLEAFNKLEVNLGNCGSNVIEAWFDTDCSETKQFLSWLSKCLTEENVIYTSEIEEYEEYEKRKLIPHAEQYQDALQQLSKQYSGIFDIEENEFEIECLEDELNMLLDDRNRLDDILQLHKNLYDKEKITLEELEKQKVSSAIKLEKAEGECFRMSCCLDEINKKLHDQIVKCSDKLLEYECPSTTTYISNMQINKYHSQYKDVISYFGYLDKKEFAGLPKLQSAVKTCSKLNGSIFHENVDDGLETLKQKVFKSIQNKNCKEAIREQLQAELKFLEHFNIYELTNCLSSKDQIEADIQLKSDHYDLLILELENLAMEVANKYIDFPSIGMARKESKILQVKLDRIKEVETVFTHIFSYHLLFYMMLIINNADIYKSDEFFRSVHHYIAHNLTRCELRMESMTDIIKQYKLYEQTPLRKKNTLLQVLLKLLLGDNMNNESELTLLNDFQQANTSPNFDFVRFRKQVQPIQNNNRILRSFLTNGPTTEFATYPFKLYEMFNEINNILNAKNNVVTSAMAIWKNTSKQLSENEWLKLKRQLWMHFLKQPQKVISSIQKIENAVEKIRAETM